MEQIMEYILSNFFLIVILLSALVGYINNYKKEEGKGKTSPKRSQQQYPTRPKQQPNPKPMDRMQTTPKSVSMDSIEEQHQKQMEKLAQSLNTSTKQAVDKMSEVPGDLTTILNESKMKSLEQERTELRKRVRNDLKGKQLMNGIIMAEVLGPPRAIKPYRSIIRERQRK